MHAYGSSAACLTTIKHSRGGRAAVGRPGCNDARRFGKTHDHRLSLYGCGIHVSFQSVKKEKPLFSEPIVSRRRSKNVKKFRIGTVDGL